jgi:flagellin-like protein
LFFFNLFVNSKPFFKKRRGLSQVIGSLLLLAIVVPLGTVLLVNGTTQINAFNNEMSSSLVFNSQGIREELVFEHIRFDPPTGDVTISLRNTGSDSASIIEKEYKISIITARGNFFDTVARPYNT